MASQPDSKNDLVFLGLNFNNFFKNCGCVKRSEDEAALLGDTTDNDVLPILQNPGPKKFREKSPVKAKEDSLSVASSTDWTDLEEIPLPGSPSGGLFTPLPDHLGNGGDDFLTQEPIDFEDLKQITDLDKEDDEERSSKSGLSRSSKKISKKDPEDKKAEAKTKGKASKKEAKEEKGKGKRNPWQPHEDAKVLELVAKYGQSWAVVASMMEGRTGKQIRDRFLNKLKSNIRRGDWAPEEDKLLLTLYYQLGHKWSKIATYLPGRTEGQVKNRFYSHIKKRIDGHVGPDATEPYSGADSLQSPESNLSAAHQGLNRLSGQADPRQASGSVSPDRYYLGDDTMKDLVSPTGSAKTATTQVSRVSADVQVNTILDKLTGYLDSKVTISDGGDMSNGYGNHYMQPNNAQQQQQYQMQNVAMFNNNQAPNANEEVMRLEQLQHRRGQLEYLLAQTLREMGTMQGQGGNVQQNNAWGGWQ